MKTITEEEIKSGQAVYSPLILSLYDAWVVHFSNRFIWRCPMRLQLAQFQESITSNHLDIGVGTGFYLRRCKWPGKTRLALMDLNPNCLATAKFSVSQLNPETFEADIFKPQPHLEKQFDSVSMNFLLHCLPGDMDNKSIVIEHAAQMLKPGGVIFGATILSDESIQTSISRSLAALYNKKGIFSNKDDTQLSLKKALEQHLQDVSIKVVGSVALFNGRISN